MVKMPCINGFGKLNGVTRAVNVDRNLATLIRPKIVDRSQMVKMIYFALQCFDLLCRDTQLFTCQVTKHGNHTRRTGPPKLAQSLDFGLTLFSDQEVNHRAFALQQFLDQALANEPGCPCNEILHKSSIQIRHSCLDSPH